MALSKITATEIEETGIVCTEVKNFDVFVTGSKYRGYSAKIDVLWDDEGGSDAHVTCTDAYGDNIKELKEDIMIEIAQLGMTRGFIAKNARRLDFTGEIDDLIKILEGEGKL